MPTVPPKAPVDLLIEQLLKLCAGAHGVVVACGDVLLKLPADAGSLANQGVTGLAVPAPADVSVAVIAVLVIALPPDRNAQSGSACHARARGCLLPGFMAVSFVSGCVE